MIYIYYVLKPFKADFSARNKATVPPRAYAARFAVHFTQHVVAVEAPEAPREPSSPKEAGVTDFRN